MTPTEQDKELREQLYALDRLRVKTDPNLPRIGSVMARVDDIVALITADRKRMALEARIHEIGLMLHQVRVNLKTSNAVAEWGDIRIAELKAQQEEV